MDRIFKSLFFRINQFKSFLLFNILNLKKIKIIYHEDTKIKLMVTNHITLYRADSFSSKEPKTLKWIEQFKNNKCFWDVGANVGLYSIYSKLHNKNTNVVSFEPSFKNLNLLNYNLALNKLNNSVFIFSLPLSGNDNFRKFEIGDDLGGGANSTLKPLNNSLPQKNINSYNLFSITVDSLINKLNLQSPDYIKIDVDGNELEILNGIKNNYKNIKEILIEIDNYKQNATLVENYLKEHNFNLYDIEFFGENNKTANFIFKK